MINFKDWKITQQTIVAEIDEIRQPKYFEEFTNISMALQINKKREKLEVFDEFEALMREA